uniref:Sugar phosphate transporter domain-containing protein n=2 Tax=Oryza brachyantha TaxID=4533 RepID=J3L5C1_ORYBR
MAEKFSNKPHIFNGSDFDYWKKKMESYITSQGYDIWLKVNQPYEIPERIDTPALKLEFENNCKARNIILNGISRSDFDRVSHLATANKIWKALNDFHTGTSNIKELRKDVFKKEYIKFEMKLGESLDDYLARFNKILSDLRSVDASYDVNYSQSEIARHFMNGLDMKVWDVKVTSIQESVDMNALTLDILYTKLKTYEMNILSKRTDLKSTALISSSGSSSESISLAAFAAFTALSDDQLEEIRGGGADTADQAGMMVGGRMASAVAALGLSVVSSVSIVVCNKALMSTLGFVFATTLTSWHLLVTFCSLHVALQMKIFENKDLDPKTIIGFGILNGISIGLLNLSLGFNSVGFYQVTKLAIIPFTVCLESIFFRKTFSRRIQMALAILLFGVGVATVTDLQLNRLGSVLSLFAVLTTCISQIMTNFIQKIFKVSSTQLLYQSCPYQALTLFIIGPFLDGFLTNQNVFAFKYTSKILVFIILSCLISVSVNFSTFLVIGKTSPVTYQVLGHLKTCIILGFGYVLFHDPLNWRNILGILLALLGMISYSYFCLMENQHKGPELSAPFFHTKVKGGETGTLLLVQNGSAKVTDGVVIEGPMWRLNRDLDA